LIKAIDDVAVERDELALWILSCLEDIAEMQHKQCNVSDWAAAIGDLQAAQRDFVGDVLDESKALEAVLAAAAQKVFLPGSVSRHDYHPAVALQASRIFARASGQGGNINDLSSQFGFVVTHCAFHGDDLFVVQECSKLVVLASQRSNLGWRLSFDPTTLLKAFSWMLSPSSYLILSLTVAKLFASRMCRMGQRMNAAWSSVLVSVLSMPDTFPSVRFPSHDRRFLWTSTAHRSSDWEDLIQESGQWLSLEFPEGSATSWQECWSRGLQVFLQRATDLDAVPQQLAARDQNQNLGSGDKSQ
jgi:hypothetical protein